MAKKSVALLSALAMTVATAAIAACPTPNTVPLRSLSAGFQAWKTVTSAMAECPERAEP